MGLDLELPGYRLLQLDEKHPVAPVFYRERRLPYRDVATEIIEFLVPERMRLPSDDEILSHIQKKARFVLEIYAEDDPVDPSMYENWMTAALHQMDPGELERLCLMEPETEEFILNRPHMWIGMRDGGADEILCVRLMHIPEVIVEERYGRREGTMTFPGLERMWNDFHTDTDLGELGHFTMPMRYGGLNRKKEMEEVISMRDFYSEALSVEGPISVGNSDIIFDWYVAPVLRSLLQKRGHLRSLPKVDDEWMLTLCASQPVQLFYIENAEEKKGAVAEPDLSEAHLTLM